MNLRLMLTGSAAVWMAAALMIAPAPADELQPALDGLVAGQQAFQRGEAQRRGEISRQLGLVEEMKWYAGVPGAGETIYYRNPYYYGGAFGTGYGDPRTYRSVSPYRDPPSLDYIYATGRRSIYSAGTDGFFYGNDIFEPWPLVPGDIWGYPYFRTVPQPIGQRQVQVSPTRWESYPVYAEPCPPPYAKPAAPPATEKDTSPMTEPTSPMSPPASGPREF